MQKKIFTWKSGEEANKEAREKLERAVWNLPEHYSIWNCGSYNTKQNAYAGIWPDGTQWAVMLDGTVIVVAVNADRIISAIEPEELEEETLNGFMNLFSAIKRTVAWNKTNQRDTKIGRARFVGEA